MCVIHPVHLSTPVPRARVAEVSRFTHDTFAARVADPSRDDGKDEYKRKVCIVCQRWFCKIKNPDPKSKFYNTFQKPECYMGWLDRFGPFRDTPEKQAEYLAAPYKGEGGLTNGWQQGHTKQCGWCAEAASTPEAQENNEKAINNRAGWRKRAAEKAAAAAPPST